MEVVIKELQNALNLQGETMVLSRFRFSDIVLATENFAETHCIGLDTTGTVYKAELDHFGNINSLLATKGKNQGEPPMNRISVAIKRIASRKVGQGKQRFLAELEMHTSYKHPNIVPLLGFCDEGDEMILVFEHAFYKSLDDYLQSVGNPDNFTWTHRLHMCLEIACGLNHVHTKMGIYSCKIAHGDLKSANIMLDKNTGARIAYFGIKLHPSNQDVRLNVYEDPEYETSKLKREYDVYTFGVILFEILCGRLAYDPVYIVVNDKGLAPIAHQCFNDGTIVRIIDPKLKEETDEDIFTSDRVPNQDSLKAFLNIAYRCLGEAAERPTMKIVINELEIALNFHMKPKENNNLIEVQQGPSNMDSNHLMLQSETNIPFDICSVFTQPLLKLFGWRNKERHYYMLSATEAFCDSFNAKRFNLKPSTGSRFQKVAELFTIVNTSVLYQVQECK